MISFSSGNAWKEEKMHVEVLCLEMVWNYKLCFAGDRTQDHMTDMSLPAQDIQFASQVSTCSTAG